MARNNIIFAPTVNNFNTTLNGAISSSATTIALNSVTGLQNKAGILVIDRVDSSGNLTPSSEEWIYFNGVSGSSVTLPSAVDGRGVGGSTAQSHADGAIVEAVFDVTIWGGMTTTYSVEHTDAGQHTAFVSDSLALSSNASISGSLFVQGNLNTASTASISGLLNLNNTNMQSGASGYAQQTKTLVAFNSANASNASLSAYEFGGSTTRLGYAQVTSNFTDTTVGSYVDVTGVSVIVTVPPLYGRMVKITVFCQEFNTTGAAGTALDLAIREGSTVLAGASSQQPVAGYNNQGGVCVSVSRPTAGAHTYKASIQQSGAGTMTFAAVDANHPAFILVELI